MYSHKVGEIQDVLVTEEAFDGEHYVAHNKFYEQVTNISVGEEAICNNVS